MKLIKSNLLTIISAIILAASFLASRLYNLGQLPIFTDEAIYTRWSQIARYDSNWRFISLTDGKQPSFVWFQMILMKFFDPLIAGRMVSVIAGFLTVVGIYFLTREIFRMHHTKGAANKIALIASTVAVFFPMLLVYDKLAIYDSLVASLFVWALYFQVLLARRLRFDISMVLGFVLGGFVLTKSSGFLSIYMTPFLFLLLEYKKKENLKRIGKFVILALVGIVIAYGMYAILRLSPFFHIIADKNLVFVQTPEEWLKLQHIDKLKVFISNSRGLLDWFIVYMTIPYIVLVFASFILTYKFLKEKIVLVLWFLLPFLSLCFFGKTLYPRYILFMVMPLIPLIALTIYEVIAKYKNPIIRIIFIAVVAFLPIRMFYYVLFDFVNSPIPKSDLEQYIKGWPAGVGVKESSMFFAEKSKSGPIFVATQGTFGLMPAAYEINFIDNKKVSTKGYWPTDAKIPDEVFLMAKKMPTYFVFYQECPICEYPGDAPNTWPLEKIMSYKKADGKSYLTVFQVKNE